MLRSTYCILSDSNDRELTDLGECPYDQGGYFVINGSEKVLIAQEKMTNNAVYVFRKKQPSKWSDVAEIKSSLDASRPAQAMHVRLLNHGQVKNVSGQCIHATVPYIREVRARIPRRRASPRAPPPPPPRSPSAPPPVTPGADRHHLPRAQLRRRSRHPRTHRLRLLRRSPPRDGAPAQFRRHPRAIPARNSALSLSLSLTLRRNSPRRARASSLQVRPSLEESFVIHAPRRGARLHRQARARRRASREKRIEYARRILQKEMLPHVGHRRSTARRRFSLLPRLHRRTSC